MKTLNQFQREHATELDAQFKKKYPNGCFTLQRWNGFGIYLTFRRPTSGHRFSDGIGVEQHAPSKYPYPLQPILDSQNNSWGKCNYYDSLEKAMIAAKKFGFPEKLIEIFTKYYNKGNLIKPSPSNPQNIQIGNKVILHPNHYLEVLRGQTLTVTNIKESNGKWGKETNLEFNEVTFNSTLNNHGERSPLYAGAFVNLDL